MKLNRKGYITIEVIVGAALTAVIAFFLIELTVKLVNKTDDYYADTLVTTDKALVIKNIKRVIESDISSYGIINTLSCSDNTCSITYANNTEKQLLVSNKTIQYDSYTKEFNAGIDNLGLTGTSNGNYILFKISGDNIFTGKDYTFYVLIFNQMKNSTLASHISNLYIPSTTIRNNSVNYDIDAAHNLIKDPLGNIRYYGANPNNYIYFNCATYPDTNCETWRIIGIIDGKMKIMRGSSIGVFSYDTSVSTINSGYGINEWSQADLMKLLNPGYDDNKDLDKDGNTVTVNNGLYYNGYRGGSNCYNGASNATTTCNLSTVSIRKNADDTKDSSRKISEMKYYIGAGVVGDGDNTVYADKSLEIERGTTVMQNPGDGIARTTSWTGMIAIPSASDYAYAADLNLCSNDLYSRTTTACKQNNWMYNILTDSGAHKGWLLTPSSNYDSRVWRVNTTGGVGGATNSYAYAAVPTLYLNNGIIIVSGDGTADNPYRIS